MADMPITRFARLGEDRIAYQMVGEGPPDLVYMPGSGQVIDTVWEHPPMASYLRRLATFSRLITFDRRGTGASDARRRKDGLCGRRGPIVPRSVLDAVGSERRRDLRPGRRGPTAMLFAATQPERTLALVLANTTARFLRDEDYPWGLGEADIETAVSFLEEVWGTESLGGWADPDLSGDMAFVRWQAKSQRAALSPKAAAEYLRWAQRTDVRQVLSSIRSPTLVLHCKRVAWITIDQGRYLAEHIRGARLIELDGANMSMYAGTNAVSGDHIGDFLKAVADSVEPDRALAAVLFTDIVGSTITAASLGHTRSRSLLDSHDAVARTLIDQHRGHLVKLTSDGVLARFDGPGRAVQSRFALRDALEPLGIQIRSGLHTGEIELRGHDIGGIAVRIARRVQTFADPGEVLVSETIPRLVTGSGINFADRGEHELKGVPGMLAALCRGQLAAIFGD